MDPPSNPFSNSEVLKHKSLGGISSEHGANSGHGELSTSAAKRSTLLQGKEQARRLEESAAVQLLVKPELMYGKSRTKQA